MMLDSDTTGEIKDAVDAGFNEQVDFTAELVKFQSKLLFRTCGRYL